MTSSAHVSYLSLPGRIQCIKTAANDAAWCCCWPASNIGLNQQSIAETVSGCAGLWAIPGAASSSAKPMNRSWGGCGLIMISKLPNQAKPMNVDEDYTHDVPSDRGCQYSNSIHCKHVSEPLHTTPYFPCMCKAVHHNNRGSGMARQTRKASHRLGDVNNSKHR
jgi:hypothetical protein